VQDRLMNVLAANPIASVLSPHYAPGHNLLRAAFLDPADRAFRQDWERATENGVAGLRALIGADVDDPDLVELSAGSDRFRELWSRHDVMVRTGGIIRFNHPEVGPLELHGEKLTISGTENLMMVVFHADPGSRGAESLALLASLVDPVREAPRVSQD